MSGHHDEFPGIDYPQINEDVVRTITKTGSLYYVILGFLGLIVVGGAGVYYYQTVNGLGVWGVTEPIYWGLDIPTFIFWIGFSLSGTLLSAILLLTKSHWRNPIYRTAEMMTGFALITAQVVVITHMGRPWRFWYAMPYPNMRGLWSNFHSPLTADVLGMVAYLVASMTFLIIGSIPDFAALRDMTTGWRKKLYTVLAFGWKGGHEQWRHFRRTYLLIACFIIPIAIGMHSVTSWVPSMTMNPGTRSTIYPLLFVVGALLSGVAGVIMILIMVRKFLNLKAYIQTRHLDHLGKLVLLASLLLSYIYIIEIFIPSIKAENYEFMPLLAKMTGKYSGFYWSMIFFNGVVPLVLFSRQMRQNTVVLFVVSSFIQVGMYWERYLMIIPTLSIGPLPSTWAPFTPSWVELALFGWELALFSFLMMGGIKIIPALSVFEVKELLPVPKRGEQEATQVTEAAAPVLAEFSGRSNRRVGETGILALYQYMDDAIRAYKRLKEAGFSNVEIQSPVPSDELDEATEVPSKFSLKPADIISAIRERRFHMSRFSLLSALAGIILWTALYAITSIRYPIQGGGIPILALPPWAWQTAIMTALIAILGTVGGLFFMAKLGKFNLGIYSPRASYDRFVIVLKETSPERLAIGREIMEAEGAESFEGVLEGVT